MPCSPRSRALLERIKTLLADLYQTGSQEIKSVVVTAILEHLFEREDIREFFASWQTYPQLRAAYETAAEWYLGGGRILPVKPGKAHRRKPRKPSRRGRGRVV